MTGWRERALARPGVREHIERVRAEWDADDVEEPAGEEVIQGQLVEDEDWKALVEEANAKLAGALTELHNAWHERDEALSKNERLRKANLDMQQSISLGQAGYKELEVELARERRAYAELERRYNDLVAHSREQDEQLQELGTELVSLRAE